MGFVNFQIPAQFLVESVRFVLLGVFGFVVCISHAGSINFFTMHCTCIVNML